MKIACLRKGTKKKKAGPFCGAGLFKMLTDQDSNLNRQNQNLQCYNYTIGQV